MKTYDLRPLLMSIETAVEEERVVVRIRTRIHPELGSGRPEEVIAALSDELGTALDAVETVRERLVLLDELEG